MSYKAFIFDLDGVIVSTDEFHYRAWKQLADTEGIFFDRNINDRLRGVSRMESLEIILERASRIYSTEEKQAMADLKNEAYKEWIQQMNPDGLLPGAMDFLTQSRSAGMALAVGSSSRNARFILARIGLGEYFDVVVDGTDIRNSKPDPEVFTLGAQRLGLEPSACLVVEDAGAGVEAALLGGMDVLAVGAATNHPKATFKARDLKDALDLWPFSKR